MGWLRRVGRGFVRLLAGDDRHPPDGPEPADGEPEGMDGYLDLLHRHPGTRTTTVRLLGGRATEDDTLFLHEHIETEDDEGNLRLVDAYDTRLCGFNHLLDQQVRPTARCHICDTLMCSMEGCTGWCSVCGSACCARHRITHTLRDGTDITYCSRCHWIHWWRLWW